MQSRPGFARLLPLVALTSVAAVTLALLASARPVQGPELIAPEVRAGRMYRLPTPRSGIRDRHGRLWNLAELKPGACLEGAVLRGARWAGVDVRGVGFNACDFSGADLTGADLQSCVLWGCRLDHARCAGADLRQLFGWHSSFVGADLRNCDLREAQFRTANDEVSGEYLADFRNADLRGARLGGAQLVTVDFRGANLARADLTGAVLVGSRFDGADLRGACLRRAQLVSYYSDEGTASFAAADLRGVNLSEVEEFVQGDQWGSVAGATFDRFTRWPADFDPQAHGARRTR